MTTKELCFLLAGADGTSGDETAAAAVVQKLLSPYMQTETDPLGNVRGQCGSGETRILLDAHIDRIGLVVRGIDDKGFLRVEAVGGADPRVLVGAEVTVMGKKPLPGVICSTPASFCSFVSRCGGVEIKRLAVDLGLEKDEAEAMVAVGDRILFAKNQYELLGSRIVGSGFDDRCGIAALIKTVQAVHDKLQRCTLIVQCSVQEEVGGSGAKTGAYRSDADLAVAVDVGFGSDSYCDKTETIALGKGPSIGIAPVLDRALTQSLITVAEQNGIPYQHDVMSARTGTNADQIQLARGGVRTALLSIPLRSMHTPVEVIDTKDVDLTADLLTAFILAKEAQTV